MWISAVQFARKAHSAAGSKEISRFGAGKIASSCRSAQDSDGISRISCNHRIIPSRRFKARNGSWRIRVQSSSRLIEDWDSKGGATPDSGGRIASFRRRAAANRVAIRVCADKIICSAIDNFIGYPTSRRGAPFSDRHAAGILCGKPLSRGQGFNYGTWNGRGQAPGNLPVFDLGGPIVHGKQKPEIVEQLLYLALFLSL